MYKTFCLKETSIIKMFLFQPEVFLLLNVYINKALTEVEGG